MTSSRSSRPTPRPSRSRPAPSATTTTGATSLRAEPGGNRVLPYLKDGTAGLLVAASMLAATEPGLNVLSADNVRILSEDLLTPFTLEASLANGSAGMLVALHTVRHVYGNDCASAPDWCRLDKYLLPLGSGCGTLGAATLRFDLSYQAGSSGILAALHWHSGGSALNLGGLQLPGDRSVTAETRKVA